VTFSQTRFNLLAPTGVTSDEMQSDDDDPGLDLDFSLKRGEAMSDNKLPLIFEPLLSAA
jgi:hypothetical protein